MTGILNKVNRRLFQPSMNRWQQAVRLGAFLFVVWFASGAVAADSTNVLTWDRAKERVTADVRNLGLLELLEDIATQSGWHIFVEPDSEFKASAKFKELPPGEALRRLLGSLNYAILPPTNGVPRLYVFRTTMNNATQSVRQALSRKAPQPRRVPNELIVRVKPGTDVEALAKSLGAKIVGVIPELNAYRFQFENEAATEAAREKLLANPDVVGVEYNYYVDNPFSPQSLTGMSAPQTKLTLDPPKQDGCNVVVGFVDTPLQSLGSLEQFVKERISVAGDSTVDNSTPTHATAMVNAFYQSIQASGRSSTAVPVIAVDVFGASGSANTFNVALGLITAGNKGATVINASLGGYGDSEILRNAVQQLAQHNIPVFAAVGNDGSNVPFYPAAYPGVVAVTAIGQGGKVASYANTGTQPDAAAPGVVVFSYNGLVYGSQGTSVSSAAAAGIAAGLADSTCAPWSKVIPTIEKALAVPVAGN